MLKCIETFGIHKTCSFFKSITQITKYALISPKDKAVTKNLHNGINFSRNTRL